MSKRFWIFVLSCTAIGLAGCFPMKRVIWSPNGERAIVLAGDGLRLCDKDGKLTAPVVADARYAAWFADSRRAAIVSARPAPTWKDAASVIAGPRRAELMRIGNQVHDEVLAYSGDFEKYAEQSTALKGLNDGELIAVLLYVRDEKSAGLAEKVGPKWDDMKKLAAEIWTLQVYEVAADKVTPQTLIVESVEPIAEPRIAPNGKLLAYIHSPGLEPSGKMYVASTDTKREPRLVTERAGGWPDWSPDGRSLAFMRTQTPPGPGEQLILGSITRQELCDADGKLLEKFDDPKDLVGIVFNGFGRVRWLKDGRILFASVEMHLPAVAEDMPKQPSLFAIDPDRQATVTRVLPRSAEDELADGLLFYDLSPDEKQIAVVVDKGMVRVCTLATGAVETAGAKSDEKETRMLPTWRSAGELCFVVPKGSEGGSPERAEVVLYRDGKSRVISKDWPAAAVAGFLADDAEKPAN